MAIEPASPGSTAAIVLGGAAAALHFAAALKGLPGLAGLPLDITPPLAALAVGAALWRLLRVPHRIGPEAAIVLALQALLALWLVVAAAWSGGQETVTAKLGAIVLIGPAMTVTGLVIAADPRALGAFAAGCVAIGLGVAILVPAAVASGLAVLGGAVDADTIRVQYQVATLALAAAAAVLAAGLVHAGRAGRVVRLAALGLLVAAALVTGGRAGFAGLAAATVLAPAAVVAVQGRLAWAASVGLAAAVAVAAFVLLVLGTTDPAGLPRTLARLLDAALGQGSVRPILWHAAWSLATPLGLGTAGFAPAAGFGDARGWHPHSLPIEALVEGGVPGALIAGTLVATAGASLIRHARSMPPAQFGTTVGLACVALAQATTSTDLGNRMAWLWLGLVAGPAMRACPAGSRRIVTA